MALSSYSILLLQNRVVLNVFILVTVVSMWPDEEMKYERIREVAE